MSALDEQLTTTIRLHSKSTARPADRLSNPASFLASALTILIITCRWINAGEGEITYENRALFTTSTYYPFDTLLSRLSSFHPHTFAGAVTGKKIESLFAIIISPFCRGGRVNDDEQWFRSVVHLSKFDEEKSPLFACPRLVLSANAVSTVTHRSVIAWHRRIDKRNQRNEEWRDQNVAAWSSRDVSKECEDYEFSQYQSSWMSSIGSAKDCKRNTGEMSE